MTTQKPISKSPISDAFLSKNVEGNYLSNDCFCVRCKNITGFPFTGKEKDPETGYSYFGARYLDHELMTMWLSVDPLADKYPSISPYAYCAWNPVKLVDPDGSEMWRPEILADKSVNYVAEQNDNVWSLYKQYDISLVQAFQLCEKIQHGKIEGKDVELITGTDFLRMKWSNNNDSKRLYHIGFSIMYNHIKESNKIFQLNQCFSGMPQSMGDNCKITSSSFFSTRTESFFIPVIGGMSIPVTFAQCTASGESHLIRDCYGIMSKKEGTVQFRMNVCGPNSGCNGLQVILIQTHSIYENQLVQSYGD